MKLEPERNKALTGPNLKRETNNPEKTEHKPTEPQVQHRALTGPKERKAC